MVMNPSGNYRQIEEGMLSSDQLGYERYTDTRNEETLGAEQVNNQESSSQFTRKYLINDDMVDLGGTVHDVSGGVEGRMRLYDNRSLTTLQTLPPISTISTAYADKYNMHHGNNNVTESFTDFMHMNSLVGGVGGTSTQALSPVSDALLDATFSVDDVRRMTMLNSYTYNNFLSSLTGGGGGAGGAGFNLPPSSHDYRLHGGGQQPIMTTPDSENSEHKVPIEMQFHSSISQPGLFPSASATDAMYTYAIPSMASRGMPMLSLQQNCGATDVNGVSLPPSHGHGHCHQQLHSIPSREFADQSSSIITGQPQWGFVRAQTSSDLHVQPQEDDDMGNEVNTRQVALKIGSELKRYSIPQAVFAQQVLGRSQGTLSDLLRNPKPWSKLKSGRDTFRRMCKWLQEPEYQRMTALRLASRITGILD